VDVLTALARWHDAGGVWRVIGGIGDDPDGWATVSLCRCDGGEEADRLRTDDPLALAYLREHPSSDEL
jgi:hypothetical protein